MEGKNNYKVGKKEFIDCIERNFKNKIFDFDSLKNEDYYYSLISYLRSNGYGYAAKMIEGCEKSIIEKDYEKVCKILTDSCLIDKIEKDLKISIKDGECIKYDPDVGLYKKIQIENENKYKIVKIKSIDNIEKEFVKFKINKNGIDIIINIEANVVVEFKESVVIRTNYGVLKFDFSVEPIIKVKSGTIENIILDYKNEKKSKKETELEYENIVIDTLNEERINNTNRLLINSLNEIELSYKDKDKIEILCNLNDIYELPEDESAKKIRERREAREREIELEKERLRKLAEELSNDEKAHDNNSSVQKGFVEQAFETVRGVFKKFKGFFNKK